MIEIILTARRPTSLLVQTYRSLVVSTEGYDVRIHTAVGKQVINSVVRNEYLSNSNANMIFFSTDAIVIRPETIDTMIHMLQSGITAVAPNFVVEMLETTELEDDLPYMGLFYGFNREELSEARFDETFKRSGYDDLDFLQQVKWKGLEIQGVEDGLVSVATRNSLVNDERAYYEEKWRSIRLGEAQLLNPARGY